MKSIHWRMFWLGLPMLVWLSSPIRAEEAKKESGTEVTVTPIVSYVTVKGNEQRFRQDWWMKDGWSGGADEVTLHQVLGKEAYLDFSGRGLFNQDDYQLQLEVVKKDVGFIRSGFSQFRRYYDSNGGFFGPFSTSSFDRGGDPHLDIGHIFVEIGLTLPDLPKIVIGYERQYKHGEKSLLEWGAVTEGSTTRNIFPSLKDIDETVDILKLDVDHDIGKVHLGDQFRFEHFRDDTTRVDTSLNLDTAASKIVTVHEDYHHDDFFNTFHMDSHVNDKFYWSLGYLFSTLDGAAGLDVATTPVTLTSDKNWVTRAIEVGSDSHVLNLSALVGPFAGLSVYGGLQAEKTESDGFTDALLTEGVAAATTNVIHSSNDKNSLQENLGLRFTKIPYTTLYADAKWTEQDIDLAERETEDGASDFERVTDTTVFRQDYSVGFNTAPLRRVTLAGRYRHRIYENDYDHVFDTEDGYPAFITAQDFTTDEVMGKLTLRPCSRFSVALIYQLVATDIDTTTKDFVPLVPGGRQQSGNYDASIYSVSATVTPLSRLYLTGLFSFQDTRTAAFDNGSPSVVTYRGDVYTMIGTAGYALDNKTDLTLEYLYSRADNLTNNSADGLPLGVENQRHGLLVGLSRRVKENIVARLRYGYYELNDRTSGGFDNYRAHLVSANVTMRF